jgi:hypothetical protein
MRFDGTSTQTPALIQPFFIRFYFDKRANSLGIPGASGARQPFRARERAPTHWTAVGLSSFRSQQEML